MDQLRFLTCGSVDDGKSTLIGRLLFEAGVVRRDQLAALEKSRLRNEDGGVNLALLTDGLSDEREQGITIDIAWKYFTTAARRFVIIDAPGHVQYTRNMVTGATHADFALVLVDARKGVLEQTRRHFLIAATLGLRGIAFCINKMDLVGYDEAVFAKLRAELSAFAAAHGRTDAHFLPVSALEGDNVIRRSAKMPWYAGPSVLELLEGFRTDAADRPAARFAVQSVIRPLTKEHRDYRGIGGQVLTGVFRPGDAVRIWPAGHATKLAAVELGGAPLAEAVAPRSVTLRFEDEIDVGRGDWIAPAAHAPQVADHLVADLCWMDEKPLMPGRRLIARQGTGFQRASVTDLLERLDIATGVWHAFGGATLLEAPVKQLKTNELGRVEVRLAAPVAFDPYADDPATGALVLIDEATNRTVAAAMIRRAVTAADEDASL